MWLDKLESQPVSLSEPPLRLPPLFQREVGVKGNSLRKQKGVQRRNLLGHKRELWLPAGARASSELKRKKDFDEVSHSQRLLLPWMESWFPRCGAGVGCLHPPSCLPAWWFLRLLLVPWTLQLAGKSVSSSRPLVHVHQSVFHPAGAANSRDLSLGICWLLLNIVDFTGEAFGDSGDV